MSYVTSFSVRAEGHTPMRHEEGEGVTAEEDDAEEERPFYTSVKSAIQPTSYGEVRADRLT